MRDTSYEYVELAVSNWADFPCRVLCCLVFFLFHFLFTAVPVQQVGGDIFGFLIVHTSYDELVPAVYRVLLSFTAVHIY